MQPLIRPLFAIFFGILSLSIVAAQDSELSEEEQAMMDRASVAYGTHLANQLSADGIVLLPNKVAEAFQAILDGTTPLADAQTIEATFNDLRKFIAENAGEFPEDAQERASIAYGTTFAQNLATNGVRLNANEFSGAIEAVQKKETPLADETAIEKSFQEIARFVGKKKGFAKISKSAKTGSPYKKENAQFLLDNGEKEGVFWTPTGLQYKVLKEGDGAKPKASDRVEVHYTGKLIDETVFDSSVERGQPITFGLNGVIAGWTEGLQLMSVGSKYRLFIPYDLGYRETGSPPKIPGYATLIFDVELLAINP
ncbi:MAG: FKBP-type peptidyl-prolyl cis-trans isomerase [Verrucomicrobiota bacterium]